MMKFGLVFLLGTLILSTGCVHPKNQNDQRKVANENTEALSAGAYGCSWKELATYFGSDVKHDQTPSQQEANKRILAQSNEILETFRYLMNYKYYNDQQCNIERVEGIIRQAECFYVFTTMYYPYDLKNVDPDFTAAKENISSQLAAKTAIDKQNKKGGTNCVTYLDKLKEDDRTLPYVQMINDKLSENK